MSSRTFTAALFVASTVCACSGNEGAGAGAGATAGTRGGGDDAGGNAGGTGGAPLGGPSDAGDSATAQPEAAPPDADAQTLDAGSNPDAPRRYDASMTPYVATNDAGQVQLVGSCGGSVTNPNLCFEYWWVPGGATSKQETHDTDQLHCEMRTATTWFDVGCSRAGVSGVCDLVRLTGYMEFHYADEASNADMLRVACMAMTGVWYAP